VYEKNARSHSRCRSAAHFAKLAITRDKDLMDFEMGHLKKKKK
jgi:hypothetical protein